MIREFDLHGYRDKLMYASTRNTASTSTFSPVSTWLRVWNRGTIARVISVLSGHGPYDSGFQARIGMGRQSLQQLSAQLQQHHPQSCRFYIACQRSLREFGMFLDPYVQVSPIDGLTLRSQFGVNARFRRTDGFTPKFYRPAGAGSKQPCKPPPHESKC